MDEEHGQQEGENGELWGPVGMGGGPPARIDLAPPTVLVDRGAKERFWQACERAVGGFEVCETPA